MLNFKTFTLDENAPWLIFIHGAGGGINTWKYQISSFKPHFNLLLLDLRDHGGSKNLSPVHKAYTFDLVCDDILEVVDHLSIHRANFISLSLGSAILQRLDQKRPQLVDKMVMAGGVFRASAKMKLFAYLAIFLSPFLPYKWIYSIFSWVVLPKKNHQFARKIYQKQAMQLRREEYLKWIGLYREFFKVLDEYYHQKLRKISLVIMGKEDHVFYGAARKFVNKQENASMEMLEKCGHICNIEQHQQFNQLALSFLRA